MKIIGVLGDGKRKYRFGKSLASVVLYASAMHMAVAKEQDDSVPANPPSDSAASPVEHSETDELLNFLSDTSTSTANADSSDSASASDSTADNVNVQADSNAEANSNDNTKTDAPAATYDLIPVNANVEKTAPESLAPKGQPAQIEEIVVTATKRNESVRQIPSTINVLTGEKLAAQGAHEMADFADQVPGLQIQDQSTSSTRKIVIRGIAPDNTTNQTVGIVYGDVPVGDPIGSYTNVDPDTWDLATVEVLKGPQGTLFGASSLAGLIRYVPKAPQLSQWQGKGFAELMSIKEGSTAPTYGAALNVPVGDEFAFRLSGTLEHRPGLIDIKNPARNVKDADDSHKWTGRAMALWQPNDRLVINALYAAQKKTADEVSFVTSYDGNYTRTDAPQSSPTKQTFNLATIDARYQFDWATLVSLSSYQTKQNHFDLDTSYALVEQLGQAGITAGRTKRFVDTTGYMQELRLVSPDGGPWTWQGGVFFGNTNAKLKADIYSNTLAVVQPLLNLIPEPLRLGFITEDGISLGNVALDPLKAEERALFGELTRQLGDVKLTVGGRLYKTQVSGVNKLGGVLPFLSNQKTEIVQNLNVKGQGFSPKFALAWQATDDVLVYGSVSKGFQYGGVNAIPIPTPNSTAPLTYASSSLWAFESGVRSNWLDNTLTADVTAYYQKWSNAQIAQITPPAETYVGNVGSVGVKGMELSLQYLFPIDGLSLEVNGSLLSSKTTKPFKDGDGNTIPAGSTMANAPVFQSAATLGYAKAFAEVWQTNSGLSYTHTSSSFGNIQHTGILDARDMFNLNFKLSRPDLSFAPSISVIVNNVTDQRKIVSSIAARDAGTQPGSTEAYPVGYTRPRTLILNLAAEFH